MEGEKKVRGIQVSIYKKVGEKTPRESDLGKLPVGRTSSSIDGGLLFY